MNRRTKPKIIRISALLIAALLSGVVFASSVSEDGSKISDGAINNIEIAWSGDLQDLYRRYNVSENDVLFVKNDLHHYLDGTILNKDTVVIATETGEPPEGLREGEDCEIVISKGDQCMIWAQGKSLSTENLMQHREVLTDAFFKRSGEKLSNRYVGMSEDLKVSKDTKLVAYGFRILSDGVTEEYGGYCSQDLSGYTEAMEKTERWFSTMDEETSNRGVVPLSSEWSCINTRTNDYTCGDCGDYGTATYWYWDDAETVADKDYFMLKSRFSMKPGWERYGNGWLNYRGYINHDWKYDDYIGTRDMLDAKPYDASGATTIGITLTGPLASLTWSTAIPNYEMVDQSDYGQDVAKWEEKINPYSTSGKTTLSVEPGSTMHCSQADARNGEWMGLAFFETKPVWIIYGPEFSEEYTPGYQGYSTSVRWTGSVYETLPTPCVLYDTNGTPGIQKDEAVNAINDYLFKGTTDKATAIAVLNCYLFP